MGFLNRSAKRVAAIAMAKRRAANKERNKHGHEHGQLPEYLDQIKNRGKIIQEKRNYFFLFFLVFVVSSRVLFGSNHPLLLSCYPIK